MLEREVIIALPKPGQEIARRAVSATRCTLRGSNRLTARARIADMAVRRQLLFPLNDN